MMVVIMIYILENVSNLIGCTDEDAENYNPNAIVDDEVALANISCL